MKPALRSTALLSASSIATILVGLATTKVLAGFLQPAGYGYYGLLQSFVAVSSLLTGMGMATGLVRLGASAANEGDIPCVVHLQAGAWLLFTILSLAGMATVLVWAKPLSVLVLGGAEHARDLAGMGIALWFTVATNVQTGLLNAWHRVEALAVYGVVSALLSAGVTMAVVTALHARGIVPAIVGGAAVSWGTSAWLVRRRLPRSPVRPSLHGTLRSAGALLSFGLPFTASALAGSGVQLALPVVVLHLLNTEAVAYYKAAAAVSVGYLGFLVTAMGQDYYPRLAAARNHPQTMVALIQEQYRLVLLIVAPMILTTLALVPTLVPLIYAPGFAPAVAILEWQLIGDLFKFSSWTLSFAVLARCSPLRYFCTELAGGVLTVSMAWLGVRLFGLAGLGLGFVATYALYYGVVRTVLRRTVPVRETAAHVRLLLVALLAALGVRLLPDTPLASCRTALALLVAALFAGYSLRALWRDHLEGKADSQSNLPANAAVAARLAPLCPGWLLPPGRIHFREWLRSFRLRPSCRTREP